LAGALIGDLVDLGGGFFQLSNIMGVVTAPQGTVTILNGMIIDSPGCMLQGSLATPSPEE